MTQTSMIITLWSESNQNSAPIINHKMHRQSCLSYPKILFELAILINTLIDYYTKSTIVAGPKQIGKANYSTSVQ